tara:strand:+ start:394 stop:780 length:387 start_codon:yes stop_codon:yes gene_type:complete
MLSLMAMSLMQVASTPGITQLICDEYANGQPNGIVWRVTLNEGQGYVDYQVIQPEVRAATRRPATFAPDSVQWRTSDRGHPVSGFIPEMGVSRIHLKLVLVDLDFVTGKFKGYRSSQCRIAEIPDRAF